MTLLVALTIPGPPVPKQRARVVMNAGRRQAYTPAATRNAEQRIANRLFAAYPHLTPTSARLRVVCRFHVKGLRGDTDNFVKLLLDGLQGRAFVNDSQVDSIEASVIRSSPDPHTEAEIWTMP